MGLDNFLSFSVLFSCFISAFFSILKFEHALDIIVSFLLLSFSLITMIQLGISMIVRYAKDDRITHFNDSYSNELEDIRANLDTLEDHSENSVKHIHDLKISELLHLKKKENT